MNERKRSFWGWGYEDRFPDENARKTLAEQVSALLGLDGLSLMPPPCIDDVTLRRPRLELPPSLSAFSSNRKNDRVTHTYGRGYRDLVRGFSRNFDPAPDFVAKPRTEEEIRAVLDWASGAHAAVIPFGGGTSVVGGVEPMALDGYAGVVSLDIRELDRLLDVDASSRLARIQAGATGPALEAQLRPHGLTLRHFPQSFELSTLGGWIATRAGGHFATLYTRIDDLVASIRMITPSGLFESRTVPGSGAGPSPDRLVLGSEGILGVITDGTMRVHVRPRFRARASISFSSFAGGVLATRALAQSGLHPANCRLLDEREGALFGVTTDGSSMLFVAFESEDHPLAAWIGRALEIAASFGGRCPSGPQCSNAEDKEEPVDAHAASNAWRSAFLEAPYLQTALVSLGLIVDTFETACTWSRFDALHAAIIGDVRAAMKRACGVGRISCRFTHVYPDGPAPYYTFMAPARRSAELEQWAEIKSAAAEAIVKNGGTITHHHAIGRVHRPWYDRERPEPFAAALRAAKTALDPAGILNPGVLIDP